jgi:amino acid transporter
LLSRVHPKFSTPYISIILYAGCSLLLASVGGFKQLAIISGISCLLIYLGVALAVIKLRRKNSADSDSFRIPGGYLVPVASILIILWLLTNLSKNEKLGILIFISLLSLVYLLIQLTARIKQARRLKLINVVSKNIND